MRSFHGNLLIGGLAVKNLDGMLEESANGDTPIWSGQFTVDPCQRDVLEVGRQYLLILDDGRNREVVLTDMNAEQEDRPVVCAFEDCCRLRTPK